MRNKMKSYIFGNRERLQDKQRGWAMPEGADNGFGPTTNLVAQGVVVIYLFVLAGIFIYAGWGYL